LFWLKPSVDGQELSAASSDGDKGEDREHMIMIYHFEYFFDLLSFVRLDYDEWSRTQTFRFYEDTQ
jgi:hypothetical protein